MSKPLEPEERQHIIDLLHEHSGNQNKVAGICGRHQTTVRRIALQEGIPSINAAPKNANESRIAYAEERRLELIGKGFDKAEDLLPKIKDPEKLQKWTVAVGTLVDKARLETGEATARTEAVDPERRRKMKESLDEIAAQRRRGERLAG